MPVNRGKKIVDARPQAVEAGVGSLPLASAQSSTAQPMPAGQRGARRVTASGVEAICVTDAIAENGSAETNTASPATTNDASTSLLRQHFAIPAAVMQRIQQQQPPQQEHHTISQFPTLPEASVVAHASPSTARGETVSAQERSKGSHHNHHAPPQSKQEFNPRHERLSHAEEVSAVAVESVSEADVASSVAALKSISTQHHDIMPSSPQSPSQETLPSEATPTTSAVAAAAAASKAKPVIFSRQWRQQLFASAGTSLPSTLTAQLKAHTTAGKRNDRTHSNSSSGSSDVEEDDDDGLSPFGNATVIKFHKSEESLRPFGGPPDTSMTAMMNATRSSSSSSDASEETNEDGFTLSQDEDEADAEGGDDGRVRRQSRKERVAARQQAQQLRDRQRVKKHMSGFDNDFLQEQEAQLLNIVNSDDEDEEEEDEGESVFSNEESAQDSTDASASGEESGEEDEEESTGEDNSEPAEELSEEGEEEKEEDEESPSVQAPKSSSGGFGAMNRARQQEAEARRARALQQQQQQQHGSSRSTTHTDSNTPESPSPAASPQNLAGLAASIGTRSQWLDTFFFAVHENRLRREGCHHTLLGLRGPVTIQGPCGLIGFGLGEVSVSGFYLGKKQMNLWHEEHQAVLMPMKKLKTKHAQDMELPQWTQVPDPAWPPHTAATARSSPRGGRAGGDGSDETGGAELLGQPLNPVHFPKQQQPRPTSPATPSATPQPANAAGKGSNEETSHDQESFLQSLQWNCEAVFGEIDWDWVEATVQSWRGLFSNKLPPILLVVQPPSSAARRRGSSGPMRKFYLSSRKRHRHQRGSRTSHPSGTDASRPYMDIPSFVARGMQTGIDLALVPAVVPAVAAQGCGAVMVLGSANIGKSTLCRFLANVLLSQHGLCYWLDLDVGQPEFGVPGQLTLTLLRRPLLRERDGSAGQTVSALFLGSNTAVQCPLSTANALAAICAQAAEVAKDHPVVVNTHGWVLQTGRRVSVEALRRLRPRQVIHLYKAKEEAWAEDTAALLDPRNGLNAEVVQRRFLVRHAPAGATGTAAAAAAVVAGGSSTQKGKATTAKAAAATAATSPASLLCRLPFAQVFETATSGSPPAALSGSPVSSPTTASPQQHQPPGNKTTNKNQSGKARKDSAADSSEWRGQVHAVRVERETTYSSIERIKATKGSRGRQQRWQTYFAPLLHFYAQHNHGEAAAATGASRKRNAVEEAETTLLQAPLSAVRSIVLAERDEKAGDAALFPSRLSTNSTVVADTSARLLHAEVAAALEHAVVAVLFHKPGATSDGAADRDGCVVRSLATLPSGFPVSCYGVVESSEEELLKGRSASEGGTQSASRGGWVRIRVPLRPSVVAAMMQPESGDAALTKNSMASADNTQKNLVKKSTAAVPPSLGATQISIAYSAGLRQDTAFVDV